MRILPADAVAGYAAGRIIRVNLAWITAKDRDTGEPVSIGVQDGDDTRDLEVIDGETGDTVSRTFVGAGGLVGIGPIALTSDLTIRQVDVTVSPLDADVEQFLRGYDLRMAPIQIYRTLFDPETWLPIAEADPRFVGFIEKAPITTPAEGGEAKAVLSCVSHTVELTRSNPDVRSDESQKLRSGDRFYRHVGTMGQRVVYWGTNSK